MKNKNKGDFLYQREKGFSKRILFLMFGNKFYSLKEFKDFDLPVVCFFSSPLSIKGGVSPRNCDNIFLNYHLMEKLYVISLKLSTEVLYSLYKLA